MLADSEPSEGVWSMPRSRAFKTTLIRDRRRRVLVPLPFDPDEVWGAKPEHRVTGTVNGMGVRAVVEAFDDGFAIFLGPSWLRGCGLEPGEKVDAELFPEGPQREDLAPDVRAALEADPDAGAFFDGLAQFYRRAYLRYIDATKRRPELRASRIAEVAELCHRGVKERPQG
jgi:Bacteriocin-protection, YdeI or OmpD-Associated/Domain of unknown function (DUF1905)